MQAAVRAQVFVRHGHVRGAGDEVVGGHAGEADAGQASHQAVPPVSPYQVTGGESLTVGKGDPDEVVVLVQIGYLLPPAEVDAEFHGAFDEDLFDLLLRRREQAHGVVVESCEVQRERAEHVAGRGSGRPAGSADACVETTSVEHAHHLTDQTVRPGLGLRAGETLQHNRTHPSQCQLAGEHQPVRAATDNYYIKYDNSPFWGMVA